MTEPRDTRIPIGIDVEENTVFWSLRDYWRIQEEAQLPGKSDVTSPAVEALRKLAAAATAPDDKPNP